MRALKQLNLDRIIFFDIETAPLFGPDELTEDSPYADSWAYKKRYDEDYLDKYFDEAGLYPEFAKIVCVSIGILTPNGLHVKSFKGEEKNLLTEFNETMDGLQSKANYTLCGHYIKGFDLPFVMRRMIVNGIEPNPVFDISGLKPWEIPHVDTKEVWPASLITITTALGLPSPKDDISGKDVGKVFYQGGIDRIVSYCERDVLAVANVVLKCRGEEPVDMLGADEEEPEVEKEPILEYLVNGGKYTDEIKEKLVDFLKNIDKEDKEFALTILSAITSTAKGQKTDFTKKHVTELKKLSK